MFKCEGSNPWARLTVAMVSGLLGCSQTEDDRFPLAGDGCGDDPCDNSAPIGGRPVGGGEETDETDETDGAGGSAGEAPDGGVGPGTPASTLTLSGEVGVVASADLETALDLAEGRVEITAIEADGSEVETQYRPGEEFSLEVSQLPIQVAVRQLDGDLDLMSTVQWATRSPTRLLIVDRAIMQQIAENLTANATFLNPERGHAFLQFIDQGNLPVSGVSVTVSDAIVAYDIGVFYTDADQQTATRGTAVLINAPAGNYPGSEQEVSYRIDGRTSRVEVPLALDAVTIRTIQL